MILIDLIYNLTLLVALSVVSGFVDTRWKRDTRLGALLQGVVFGGAAVIAMLRPLVLAPGLIFDGRSVMISLGALFFGPWTASVACHWWRGNEARVRQLRDAIARAARGEFVRYEVELQGMGQTTATIDFSLKPVFNPFGQVTLLLLDGRDITERKQAEEALRASPDEKVALPRALAPVVVADPVVEAKSLRGVETVLLVEDELQILNLAQRILVEHGYTVLSAHLPEAALSLVEQHPGAIHLLVTDIVMPGMNGRELWERVAALKPGLRCLFMSGYTANVIAHQGILEADMFFVQKPFTIEILTRKVREVLEA